MHGTVTPKFTKPRPFPRWLIGLCSQFSCASSSRIKLRPQLSIIFFKYSYNINNHNNNYSVYPKTIGYLIPRCRPISAIYERLTYGQHFEQRAWSLSMKQAGKASSKNGTLELNLWMATEMHCEIGLLSIVSPISHSAAKFSQELLGWLSWMRS